jgi:hypothetical protein
MAKKLIFICIWMTVGFVMAAIIGLSAAALIGKPQTTDDRNSAAWTVVYILFGILPFVGIGIPLVLGLLGKLPGTKRDVIK